MGRLGQAGESRWASMTRWAGVVTVSAGYAFAKGNLEI
jgi:hypothetical protein